MRWNPLRRRRLRTVCRVRFGGIVRNDSDFFRLVADISFVAVAKKNFDPDLDFRSSLDLVGATRRGGGVDDRNLSTSGSFSSFQASFAKNLRKNPPVRVRRSGVSGPNDVRLRRRDFLRRALKDRTGRDEPLTSY